MWLLAFEVSRRHDSRTIHVIFCTFKEFKGGVGGGGGGGSELGLIYLHVR
ncbi:unnamed protein product [Mesocestoides corti]|uniref:Uncharacterized protein n=1 Tax=Mesocestoides corti TaxID=53468 RepID=A0A0R3UDS8_MESCO|nr:unnamed protein product [Mesocestoides corti]